MTTKEAKTKRITRQEGTNFIKVKGKLGSHRLFAPENPFGKERWIIDVLLDAQGVEEAKEHNLRVKKTDFYTDMEFDGYSGEHVEMVRPVLAYGNEKRPAPNVIDPHKNPVPSDLGLGYGTDVLVKGMIKSRDMDGSEMSPAQVMSKYKGYGLFFSDVMILNLVPYVKVDQEEEDFIKEASFDVSEHVNTQGPSKGSSTVGDFDDEVPFN